MFKQNRFSLSFLFVVTYFAAISFTRNMLLVTAVLTIEPLVIWITVSVLMWGLPQGIIRASQDNCYRMDGSVSDRRTAMEIHSMEKVRWDLYFVLIALVMTSDWLYFIAEGFGWLDYLRSENASAKLVIPFVVATLGWLAFCGATVRRIYLASVKSFSLGVNQRAKLNLEMDIAAVQSQFEHEQQSIA